MKESEIYIYILPILFCFYQWTQKDPDHKGGSSASTCIFTALTQINPQVVGGSTPKTINYYVFHKDAIQTHLVTAANGGTGNNNFKTACGQYNASVGSAPENSFQKVSNDLHGVGTFSNAGFDTAQGKFGHQTQTGTAAYKFNDFAGASTTDLTDLQGAATKFKNAADTIPAGSPTHANVGTAIEKFQAAANEFGYIQNTDTSAAQKFVDFSQALLDALAGTKLEQQAQEFKNKATEFQQAAGNNSGFQKLAQAVTGANLGTGNIQATFLAAAQQFGRVDTTDNSAAAKLKAAIDALRNS